MTRRNLRALLSALALLALLGGGAPALADEHAGKNPCNPCAAENPCNPCAAPNPCNPCAAPNPCNPCAGKVGKSSPPSGGAVAPTAPAPRKKPRSY